MSSSIANLDLSHLIRREDPEAKYEILAEIGQGSFGSVYKARDRETGAIVAIKKMTCNADYASEEWEDIFKEIAFMGTIEHDNMVKHLASFLKGHTVWVVMEFCMGSLQHILEVFKAPLHEAEIAAVLARVVEGLAYLHSKKRIHRDIKAANILVTSRGKVKLGDFGSGSMGDPANTFVGTPCWMAPEVITAMEAGLYTCKADIWSLGITAIELAERKPPLMDMNTMSTLYHIPQNPPPTLKKPESWSPHFVEFISCCLRKDPEERLSAQELLQHPFLVNDKANHNRNIKLLVRRSKAAASAGADFDANAPLASIADNDEPVGDENEELKKRKPRAPKPKKERSNLEVDTSGVAGGGAQSTDTSPAPLSSAATAHTPAPAAATPGGAPGAPSMLTATNVALSQLSMMTPTTPTSFSLASPMPGDPTPPHRRHTRMASLASEDGSVTTMTSSMAEFHLNDMANDDWERQNQSETIRPMRREAADRDNPLLDAKAQLKELKALQTAQQKQTKNLVRTHEAALAEVRRQQEKDVEVETRAQSNDLEKVLGRMRAELEQFVKAQASDWKNFRKEQQNRAKSEVKEHNAEQRRVIKDMEKALKERLSTVPKDERKAAKEAHEAAVEKYTAESDQAFLAAQQARIAEEAKQFALRAQAELHDLEVRQFETETERRRAMRDVNGRHRLANMRYEHNVLETQLRERHDCAQVQQAKILALEGEQMAKQHKKDEKEQKKQHAHELKLHPKHVKSVRAKMIREKQETVRLTKQKFEELQRSLLEDASKEERRKIKEAQKVELQRNVTMTEEEFEKKILETIEHDTLELDQTMKEQQEALLARHERDRTELETFQQLRRERLRVSQATELTLLQATHQKALEELEQTIHADYEAFLASAHETRAAMAARHAEERERLSRDGPALT